MTQTTTSVTNAALIGRADSWRQDGHDLALAFVMQTWGSSPRPVGSIMIIRDDMAVEGSVSGGCVEGAVIDAGLDSIATGTGQGGWAPDIGHVSAQWLVRPSPAIFCQFSKPPSQVSSTTDINWAPSSTPLSRSVPVSGNDHGRMHALRAHRRA